MMHYRRRYSVREYSDLNELAEALTSMTWCECNAFKWKRLVLANDSTSADGAQEYAVIMNDQQVESLTVSWMDKASLIRALERIESGDPSYAPMDCKIGTFDHPESSCRYCA